MATKDGGEPEGGQVLKRKKWNEVPPLFMKPDEEWTPPSQRKAAEAEDSAGPATPVMFSVLLFLAIASLGNCAIAFVASGLETEQRVYLFALGLVSSAVFGALASVVRSTSDTAYWAKAGVDLLSTKSKAGDAPP